MEPYSHFIENKLNKSDIFGLCKRVGILCNTSWTKHNLSVALESKILNEPALLTKHLSHGDFKTIRTLINAGGKKFFETPPLIETLERWGMIRYCLPDPKGFSITIELPEDLASALSPIINSILTDKALIEVSTRDSLLIGLVNLYGVICESDLLDLYKQVSDKDLNGRNLLTATIERDFLSLHMGKYLVDGQFLYVSKLSMEPDYVLNSTRSLAKLDYFRYSCSEVLKASDVEYYPATSESIALLEELSRRGVEQPAYILHIAWAFIQNEVSLSKILSLFTESVSFDNPADLNGFAQFIFDYQDSIRMWNLKGHSPEELFQVEQQHMC